MVEGTGPSAFQRKACFNIVMISFLKLLLGLSIKVVQSPSSHQNKFAPGLLKKMFRKKVF